MWKKREAQHVYSDFDKRFLGRDGPRGDWAPVSPLGPTSAGSHSRGGGRPGTRLGAGSARNQRVGPVGFANRRRPEGLLGVQHPSAPHSSIGTRPPFPPAVCSSPQLLLKLSPVAPSRAVIHKDGPPSLAKSAPRIPPRMGPRLPLRSPRPTRRSLGFPRVSAFGQGTTAAPRQAKSRFSRS